MPASPQAPQAPHVPIALALVSYGGLASSARAPISRSSHPNQGAPAAPLEASVRLAPMLTLFSLTLTTSCSHKPGTAGDSGASSGTGDHPWTGEGNGTSSSPYDADGTADVYCIDAFSETTDEHFSPASTWYASGTAPGAECVCDFHIDNGGALFASYGVEITGDASTWAPAQVVTADNRTGYYSAHYGDGSGSEADYYTL